MNILVLLKMVPDVVEELELAPDGKGLDADALRMIPNESDGHAVEEALLLKERHGGKVTVVGIDAPEIDDALFTALASGADRAVKVTGAGENLTTRTASEILAEALAKGPGLLPADLILTGTQANDDLDGLVAALLAHKLDIPYLGIVTKVTPDGSGKGITVIREYPAGYRGEFELALPAALGIQAAEKPPRYVPVAKVRAAMKALKIETVPASGSAGAPMVEILEMKKPVVTGRAEMLEGAPEEIAGKLAKMLADRGLV
jgi:electron transfer flavoprotein beta subunit